MNRLRTFVNSGLMSQIMRLLEIMNGGSTLRLLATCHRAGRCLISSGHVQVITEPQKSRHREATDPGIQAAAIGADSQLVAPNSNARVVRVSAPPDGQQPAPRAAPQAAVAAANEEKIMSKDKEKNKKRAIEDWLKYDKTMEKKRQRQIERYDREHRRRFPPTALQRKLMEASRYDEPSYEARRMRASASVRTPQSIVQALRGWQRALSDSDEAEAFDANPVAATAAVAASEASSSSSDATASSSSSTTAVIAVNIDASDDGVASSMASSTKQMKWYDAQDADDEEAQVEALQQEALRQEANQQELTHEDYLLRSAVDAQVRMVCADIHGIRGRWAETP